MRLTITKSKENTEALYNHFAGGRILIHSYPSLARTR